ncbi:MAG: PSD1 and planctomycete cytochrome C domain-containing protein [Planctomycetota bacterium]
MVKRKKLFVGTAALFLGCLIQGSSQADDAADRHFTIRVLPVLKEKCLGCHGVDEDDLKGEFSITDLQSMIRGGESGEPGIVPGEPDAGTVMEAIKWEGFEMPPKENDRLTDKQIEHIRLWIEKGASWPDEQTQQRYRDEWNAQAVNEDGVILKTSGGTSDEWSNRRYKEEDLWAFRPVRDASEVLPDAVAKDDAIDHFLDRKLADAGLDPSPRAEPTALIRRAYFDLIGLPPTPEDVDEFVVAWKADSDQAWNKLIDDLLESPRYGERWGRHWLDITRYADTGGMSNDYERSNMWRYRDYVIRSFNEDKPYDQFIVEQLAGDELADESYMQRNGGSKDLLYEAQINGDFNEEESEWIVATGFLRLGPWDNAMVDAEEARQMYLDDTVNITGQTFLSTTMRCCKCHDHKFDPIPTRDYYRMYAAFSTTRMAERNVPFVPEESLERRDSGREHAERMLAFAVERKNALVAKREAAAKAWFEDHGLPYKNNEERKSLPDDEKPPRHVGLSHVEQGRLKVREQDEWIWKRRFERYEAMAQSVYNTQQKGLAWNGARKLRIDRNKKKKATSNENFIFLGGALTALGDRVFPGVLSAVAVSTDAGKEDPYLLPDSVDGRRLSLARWIANEDNPLTTRSIINRVWQFHFGQGIARNSNNFGATGAKPTHPELLDYLASEFVEGGWKLKHLHRMIMQSEAYQRSTLIEDLKKLDEADPDNKLLSFFPRRRLSAEEIRDSLLQVTGELVHSNGGLPVMPEINMEVALQPRMIQFSLAPAYQPSRTPEERNRRTIYAYHVRGQADPFTELFNQPNPNESCELRESASVTPQVFTLLNSEMLTDRSIAMASRLMQEHAKLDGQIRRAFRLLFGRDAMDEEVEQLTKYVVEMRDYHRSSDPAASEYPEEITRSLVEEFSGKPFEYQEILSVFENYIADKKPDQVDAGTRALADMCLLLMNANEFMYVE